MEAGQSCSMARTGVWTPLDRVHTNRIDSATPGKGDRKGGWAALRMPRPQTLGGATTP